MGKSNEETVWLKTCLSSPNLSDYLARNWKKKKIIQHFWVAGGYTLFIS